MLIYTNSQDPNFSFLQENYHHYLNALKDGSISQAEFSHYEKRLFPGFILAILPFTYLINDPITVGISLNLIFFVISFILIWKIFKNIFINFLFAFFPPIWILQTTKSSTEPLTITLFLASFITLLKKHYLTTGIIIGIAFNVRIIAICLFFAIAIFLFFEKRFNELTKVTAGFLITSSFLIIYNYFIFGEKNILIQFTNLDQNYGVVRIGFIQIFHDILRTIDWGQYKILFSGIFYLIINFGALVILYYFKNKSGLIKICFYWVLFSLIFIFLLSPFTLIENFARYVVPVVPAICLAIDLFVKMVEKKSVFLPEKPELASNKKRVKAHE